MKDALTYTVVAGSRKCVNSCPICIAKMTDDCGIGFDEPYIDWEQFDYATDIAMSFRCRNFLITSKGEAALLPAQVTKFLHRVEKRPFRRELQTEGSVIANGGWQYEEFLRIWKDHGLKVLAVSIYHHDDKKNHEVFRQGSAEGAYSLKSLIEKLNSLEFNVRLSCVMLKGYIDSVDEVRKLIDFSRQYGVFQLTLRRADRPKDSLDQQIAEYVDSHRVDDVEFNTNLACYLKDNGRFCDVLPHGALVYEVGKQNVCVTTGLGSAFGDKKAVSCLEGRFNEEDIRQLIFIPPDILTTSWETVNGGRIL